MPVVDVLIVEDDAAVSGSLARAVRLAGYEARLAATGTAALDQVERRQPQAVILDLMLPDLDGLDVCRQLHARAAPPAILILTARTTLGDRIEGLDAGADDYLVKPFALAELLARLRAILRRTLGRLPPVVLRYEDVALDPARHTVTRQGRAISLTRTEFQLLELLLRNARIVLTRETIFDRIWGYDFGPSSHALEVYVSYLRRKLGPPNLIHSVRGIGYVLRSE
jgi:two-component system, OmpR family, response regulator MprA